MPMSVKLKLVSGLTRRASLTCAAAATILLASQGCTPMVLQSGYIPDEAMVADLRVGVDNMDSVSSMLGSPTNVAAFRHQIWYYMSSKTQQIAFFEPELVEQDIIAIAFDENDQVAQIERYDLADVQKIKMVDRTTPTRGKELGLLEQLFGNFGRFNKGGDNPSRVGRQGGGGGGGGY